MKIEAVTQRHGPRSICRGRNPFPVIVAYFEPREDRRDWKYTPTVVMASRITAYAEASPTWLGYRCTAWYIDEVNTWMPTGSPRSAGTSNDSRARTKRMSIVAKTAGHDRRSVTRHATWKTLAPLIIALSSSAGSIARKAADMRRNAMGE